MKSAPDPVMSDVVRQRLEMLLTEVQPRHALPEPPSPPGAEWRPVVDSSPAGNPDGASQSEGEPDSTRGEAPVAAGAQRHHRALHALSPAGGAAARAAWRAIEFASEHLVAVLIVLLVGCGWTAYSLLQARTTPVAVAAPPSVVSSPSVMATAAPRMLVHVLGAVHRPGVVELAEGSRVEDAIAEAGGLTKAADPAELNLAAVVADGAQVVIGTHRKPRGEVRGDGAEAGAGRASGSPRTVSLNTATLEQLDGLPGVGPVTAQKILAWRQKHGRFTSVSELQEVDGIGPKTYADIAPNVRT
jgi:competence protein ComEA